MGLVEVVDTVSESDARFTDLDIGETFRYNGKIYLKFAHKSESFGVNALSFQDNTTHAFGARCGVIRVNCKLVVEG